MGPEGLSLNPEWINTIVLALVGAGFTLGMRGRRRNGNGNGECPCCGELAKRITRLADVIEQGQADTMRYHERAQLLLEELVRRRSPS